MLNVKHFSPRFSSAPPPFPLDEDEMVESMKRTRLNDEDEDEDDDLTTASPPALAPVEWEIKFDRGNVESAIGRSEHINVCMMGMRGGIIVGAGEKGSVWIWKR